MPSKEELCLLATSARNTTQDFLARDVEQLVSEIKENLRLSGLKSRSSLSAHRTRVSPYNIPSRGFSEACGSCASPKTGLSCLKKAKSRTKSNETDDPYEMLQELLREGSLIKEAVRRLQMGLSPKQRYFYDTEEETRSPSLPLCDLEV